MYKNVQHQPYKHSLVVPYWYLCFIHTEFQWCIWMDQQQEARGRGGHCGCAWFKEVRQSNLQNEKLLKWHQLSSTYSFVFFFNEDGIQWYWPFARSRAALWFSSSCCLISFSAVYLSLQESQSPITCCLKAKNVKVTWNFCQIYRPPLAHVELETFLCHKTLFSCKTVHLFLYYVALQHHV